MSDQQSPEEQVRSAATPNADGSRDTPISDLVSRAAGRTDDIATIISKSPPTQAYVPLATSGNDIRGRRLAHFELLEPIGVGGMAAVIRARDTLLDRIVALKILPPAMASDVEHVNRFHQEARAAAKLDHENIARVYFCGEDQKLHFIAFEFVEGQNLRTVLERCGGRLPVQDSVHYMLQIAACLAHAAARGVVHRDIKPSNIIITASGRAKLVDMGLARSLGPQDKKQLTQSGVTLGTFDYISPEQALEPRDADVRSDMYSLGCTFYHMLTGQPPVPDGTAAKKLHHHQHVAPIDPRQLNPEIPNEVAAILHRMMAKDPKDRYQQAEQLVQHLIYVAHKLDGVEVSTNSIYVEAPLPAPPRKRPLLLAAIGATLLALVVTIVALVPPRGPTSRPPAAATRVAEPISNPKNAGTSPLAKDVPALPEKRVVFNEVAWDNALAEDRPLRIVLQSDLNINEGKSIYRGGSTGKSTLEVESANADKPATIRFSYVPEVKSDDPYWAGLTMDGGNVVFRNIHFIVEATRTPRNLVAGMLVKSGQVQFERCTFSQQTPMDEELIAWREMLTPIASVGVWDPRSSQPVVFRQCYFANGQAAVSVKGGARIEQVNCAFGPHSCLFHVWGQDPGDNAELTLKSISAQVADGPVFRIDEDVSCMFSVQNSIFCGPSDAGFAERPDLIRQTGDVRSVVFKGRRNAYYHLTSYWAKQTGINNVEGADWATFKKLLAKMDGSDLNSSILKSSPWLRSNPGLDDPKAGFLIDEHMSELRQENDKKKPIGVEVCVWGELYPNGLRTVEPPRPIENPAKLGPRERLVDPSGSMTGERVHKKLEAAISEAEFDDVILIKHTGELRVEPTALTEDRRLTLRPYADYQPILVLGKTTETMTALFHLSHSQMEFERLEFLLRPEAGHRALSVVSVAGDSVCRFSQCVLTLDNADNPMAALEAVTVLEQFDFPRPIAVGPEPQTELRLRQCFIRGRGTLLGVKVSRPFELSVEASLICLTGSLLDAQPSSGDGAVEGLCKADLDGSTMYFAGPTLRFTTLGGALRLIPIRFTATRCLFGAASGRPLVRADGIENESQLKAVLKWTGKSNAYVGYDSLLELGRADGDAILTLQSDDWKVFSGAGPDTRFDRIGRLSGTGMERGFGQLLPLDFAPRAEWSSYGVNVESLPRPTAESSGRPRWK